MTDAILYITAPSIDPPADALELERVTSTTVTCVSSLASVDERVAEADCVVFAAGGGDGPSLRSVAAVASDVPVVLYAGSDAPEPIDAGALSGVDGYVRRQTAESVSHLADEIDRLRAATEIGGDDDADSRSKIDRLHEMATRIVACRDETRLFELAIETADGVLEFDASSISVYEERESGEWMVPKAASSAEIIDRAPDAIPLGDGIVSRTFETGDSVRIGDLEAEPDAIRIHDAHRSGISVPVGDCGVFQAISVQPDAYDAADVELAEILATHVAETIRRIRLEDRLRSRRETVTRLHEGTARIVAAEDEREIYDLAVDAAENILEFDNCVLLAVEGARFVPAANSSKIPDHHNRTQPLGHGVMGETYRTRETIRIGDTLNHPLVETNETQYRSVLSVPLEEFGVFQTVSERPDAFDNEDEELAELLASHVSEVIARVRAEADLVAERDRLSALFDNVPDPTVCYEFDDDDAIVRDVNEAFERQFGYDREAIVGENIDDYIVPAEFEDEARTLNETLIAGESLRTVSRRRADGEVRDVLINVVPLEMGERGVEGFSIYTDITEQKRRERELTEQNERLDEFASIVSHDLRNPLNVARGYLELAIESGDDSHFEEVDRAHERMAMLIEKLLTLSRHGEVIDETEAIAVHDAAERAWAAVDTDDARLELAGDRTIEADPGRLVELLENLLRNAVEHSSTSNQHTADNAVEHSSTSNQHTADDAVEHSSTIPSADTRADAVECGSAGDQRETDGDNSPLTVRVGATDRGLFVADNGAGIPEDDREIIFESGYTTTPGGTGYGLAIVEQIADAHGWTIGVTESDSGGARFDFETAVAERDEPS